MGHPMIISRTFVLVILAAMLLGCRDKEQPPAPDPPKPSDSGKASVWLTRGDKTRLLTKEADLAVTAQPGGWPEIAVDTAIILQQIEGFGAALTGSSAWLFRNKLSDGARQTLFTKLFDTVNGAGISFLRLTIGASDFSTSYYSYDDIPAGQTDFDLLHFSLGPDTVDVIPMLRAILDRSPKITLMGSPWSPPAWMKTNGSLIGGKLRTDCQSVYAGYFIRYIQAMSSLGFHISAITPQNEPLHAAAAYPCMEMQWGEQADFIRNHLGPKFRDAGISTRIIIYDHNWDNTNYAISILNDPETRKFVAGSAFHAYAGDVSAMTVVHLAHPDKDLFFTEICGGTWATNWSDNLMWNMRNIFIGTTKNWSKCALLWNLALDQNGGPHEGGSSTLRGVVTIHSTSGQVTYNEEYFSLAHFSKFIRPGAFRTGIIRAAGLSDLDAVSFINPDGTKAMVVCNYGDQATTFTVRQGTRYFNYTLSGRSVVTLVWK